MLLLHNMADTPKYSSIIDEFLDAREPDWKDLGLKDAKKSGDEWLDRTHAEADTAFIEDIAEGASKHTAIPPTSKGATLTNRLREKDAAAPRLGVGRVSQTSTGADMSNYKSAAADDASLFAEVTESLEEAAKGGKVEKKNRSDAEIQRYVHQLLNQGEPPAKVAAQLKKLAEVELFNHQMGTRYLQDNAGMLGMTYLEPKYLEPNTFMDKQNPQYGHTAARELSVPDKHMLNIAIKTLRMPDAVAGVMGPPSKEEALETVKRLAPNHPVLKEAAGSFNSVSEMKQLQGQGGVVSQIRPGDRVTILTQQGQERSGRAVMYNAQQECWVLNMGGPHGTPGIANEENIVRVSKSKRNKDQGAVGRLMMDSNHIAADDIGWAEGENTPEKPTPVIFRKWKDTGDILALFPYDLGTDDPYTCSSYEHMGQHGAADPQGCIQTTTRCTPEEYAPLKRELESLGYKLKPMSRLQYSALLSRKEQLKQYSSTSVPKPNEDDDLYLDDGTLDDNPESHLASSSNDCVRQAKAWKAAGIKPRAKSVKQITACTGCSYFKKNGSTKSCGLYGLPVVGNAAELTAVVNKMTAGVPANLKKAALVQIANRTPEHNTPVTTSVEAPFVRQASFTKVREFGFKETPHFSGAMVQKAHAKGHSLKVIMAAAEKRYDALEASKGIREFIASLHKEKGKIVMAKADANYLKVIGIRNEAIVGAAKCASCKAHTGKELHKAASTEGVTRVPDVFMETTLGQVRGARKRSSINFDSASVAKLHTAGHSVEKIFKAASAKVGTAQASKAIRDWAHNLKNTNTKIALSQIDCTVLKKMGVKLGSQNAIIGAAKCASCNYRNGMHCGLTGGTLLNFPGMNTVTSNKKVAAGAPEDGRSILKEYDLMSKSAQGDIDMTPPDRAEVQMDSKMNAGEIE